DTTVELFAVNTIGILCGGPPDVPTARFNLPARSKDARLLQQLIPATQTRAWDGGFMFVRTTNNVPIFGTELFFLRDGIAMANVPASSLPSPVTYTPPRTEPTDARSIHVELLGPVTLNLGNELTIVTY